MRGEPQHITPEKMWVKMRSEASEWIREELCASEGDQSAIRISPDPNR